MKHRHKKSIELALNQARADWKETCDAHSLSSELSLEDAHNIIARILVKQGRLLGVLTQIEIGLEADNT